MAGVPVGAQRLPACRLHRHSLLYGLDRADRVISYRESRFSACVKINDCSRFAAYAACGEPLREADAMLKWTGLVAPTAYLVTEEGCEK